MSHISTAHEVLAAVFQARGVDCPGNPHFTCCYGSVHSSRNAASGRCPVAGLVTTRT